MTVARAVLATLLLGAGAALAHRARHASNADWYEPVPAYPSLSPLDDEGALIRRLLAGEISRDRYRNEVERLAS